MGDVTSLPWTAINKHGAGSIRRVCGVYEIFDQARVPDARYKIKVLQRAEDDFVALPNFCVKSTGWRSGLGRTEAEALQDALSWLGKDLDSLGGSLQRDRFEWADPKEF
jgi:hypothetical protein